MLTTIQIAVDESEEGSGQGAGPSLALRQRIDDSAVGGMDLLLSREARARLADGNDGDE